jgi:hypothetical protein
MNKYVNSYRERVPSSPWERSAVGLISCASAGREGVRHALGGLEGRIFVAEYRRKLPSEATIGVGLGGANGGEVSTATGEDAAPQGTDRGEPGAGR